MAEAVCECVRMSAAAAGATVIAVADPSPDVSVGSGSATLNALVVVGEALSARAGFGTLSAEPLHAARVLIVLVGAVAGGGKRQAGRRPRRDQGSFRRSQQHCLGSSA
jgi:hypothetical protein